MTTLISCKDDKNRLIFQTKEVSLRLDKKYHMAMFYDK